MWIFTVVVAKLTVVSAIDPFGGDPFRETDPFKASSEDFFKKTTKLDPFSTADPFSKSATLPSKVLDEVQRPELQCCCLKFYL